MYYILPVPKKVLDLYFVFRNIPVGRPPLLHTLVLSISPSCIIKLPSPLHSSLILFLFALVWYHQRFVEMSSADFDFVIVGGGLAGLVLGACLSEDSDTTVLVIEAGKDVKDDPRVDIPAMWPSLLNDPHASWQFKTVPQVCPQSLPRLVRHTALLILYLLGRPRRP